MAPQQRHCEFTSKLRKEDGGGKMKLFLFFLLLIDDVWPSDGKQRFGFSEPIRLQFPFDPFYNAYAKQCCKFYLSGCYEFINNRRYTNPSFLGRAFLAELNGLIEVTIRNTSPEDSGLYRCAILDTSYPIYADFQVQVSEVSIYRPRSTRPPSDPSNTDRIPSGSIGPEQNMEGTRSNSASVGILLAAVFGVATVTLIGVITMVVRYKKKKATKQCDDSQAVSPAPDPQPRVSGEQSVVYTVLDFKKCEEQNGLYANMQLPSRGRGGPNPDCVVRSLETVEYSTVARAQ